MPIIAEFNLQETEQLNVTDALGSSYKKSKCAQENFCFSASKRMKPLVKAYMATVLLERDKV